MRTIRKYLLGEGENLVEHQVLDDQWLSAEPNRADTGIWLFGIHDSSQPVFEQCFMVLRTDDDLPKKIEMKFIATTRLNGGAAHVFLAMLRDSR